MRGKIIGTIVTLATTVAGVLIYRKKKVVHAGGERMSKKSEKELLEEASAEAFLPLYNEELGESFELVEMKDAPDARCKDKAGNVFNFEITMTQDAKDDIAAALGRLDKKSIAATRKRLDAGKVVVNCLQGNVLAMLKKAVKAKSLKDYGSDCGLLVRDTSAVMWDWEEVVNKELETELAQFAKPFSKGIWLLSFDKKRIYSLHPGGSAKKES